MSLGMLGGGEPKSDNNENKAKKGKDQIDNATLTSMLSTNL